MKFFSLFIAALFLFLNLSFASASLEETCKKLSQEADIIDFNFCLTSLQADPNSSKADVQGLTIIAANLAKANVTHNRAKAQQLLNDKSVTAKGKKALHDCIENYGSSADAFQEAVSYIKSFDYENANNQLSAALTDVNSCTQSWKDVSQTSPMAEEDDDAVKLSHLVLAFAALH